MTEPAAATGPRAGETVIRIAGGVVTVWAAVLAAVFEAFLVPLRVADVRAPVSLLLAVVVNLALPWLGSWLTRSKFGATLPALAWFVVILTLTFPRAEGDAVFAGNDWVALVLLLLGSATAAAGAYFALLGQGPAWLRRSARPGR